MTNVYKNISEGARAKYWKRFMLLDLSERRTSVFEQFTHHFVRLGASVGESVAVQWEFDATNRIPIETIL